MAEEQAQEEQPTQLFTDHVIEEAKVFSEFLLKTFPELEGVAVALSWRPPLSNLPSAVIRGRRGPISSPGEVVHMMEQVLKIIEHLQQQLQVSLRLTDDLMAEKAKTLKYLEEQIEQADEFIRDAGAISRDADTQSGQGRSTASITDTTEDF